jgi:hypothetical protein
MFVDLKPVCWKARKKKMGKEGAQKGEGREFSLLLLVTENDVKMCQQTASPRMSAHYTKEHDRDERGRERSERTNFNLGGNFLFLAK